MFAFVLLRINLCTNFESCSCLGIFRIRCVYMSVMGNRNVMEGTRTLGEGDGDDKS